MFKVHRVQLWIFVHVLNKLVSLMTFCSYQYVGRISAERGSCLSSARVKTLISSFIDRRITQQENRVSCITMTFTLTSVHLQVSSSPLYHQLRTRSSSWKKISPCRKISKDSLLLLCLYFRLRFWCCHIKTGQSVTELERKWSPAVHAKTVQEIPHAYIIKICPIFFTLKSHWRPYSYQKKPC